MSVSTSSRARGVINKLGVGKKAKGGPASQQYSRSAAVLEGSDETVDLSPKTSQAVRRASFLLGERYTLQARRIEVVVKNKKEGGDYNYEALSFIRELHDKSPKVDKNGNEIQPFVFNLPARLNKSLFAALWSIYGSSIIVGHQDLELPQKMFVDLFESYGLNALGGFDLEMAQKLFADLFKSYGPEIGNELKGYELVKIKKHSDQIMRTH